MRRNESKRPSKIPAPDQTTRRSRLADLVAQAMRPESIKPPVIDPQLETLGSVERAGEVLRYSLRRAEFWLSPGGTLRGWPRFNLRLALWLGIPACLITPIITVLLTTAVTWSAILVEIARNLVLIPAWLGSALLVTTALSVLWRFLFGR